MNRPRDIAINTLMLVVIAITFVWLFAKGLDVESHNSCSQQVQHKEER